MTIPTGALDVTRNIQFFEQTAVGAFINDPVFKNAGLLATLDDSRDKDNDDVEVVGSRDIYSVLQSGEEGTVDVTYKMMDTVLPRYGTEIGSGAGTIDKVITLCESRKINAVEMFRLFRDCITDKISLKFGKYSEVTQTFYCPYRTPWMDLTAFKTLLSIATNPQWASAPTAPPWSNLSYGTATPLTINSVNTYDVEGTFTCDVSNNIIKQKPLGNVGAKYVAAGKRRISGSFDVDLEGIALDTLFTDGTEIPITFRVFAGSPNVDLSITNALLVSDKEGIDAGSDSFDVQSFGYKAAHVSLTAYP